MSLLRGTALSLLAAAACGSSALAQATDTARVAVAGTVYDSTARAPLAAAVVQLAARSKATNPPSFGVLTDSAGAFRIADVPPGDYLATFAHPRLDSLGVAPAVRLVRVAAGMTRLDFAIPGARTVRAALCGSSARGDSSAAIVGAVTTADGGAPVRGASVTAQWLELNVGAKGLVRSRPSIRTAADSAGRYVLCGIPGDVSVDLWATAGRAGTGTVHVALAPFAVIPAPLALDPADTLAGAGARHGSAQVSGLVRLPDGSPAAGARVRVRDTDRETITDEHGRYALVDLPAGTFALEARAIGFVPIARVVTLSATRPATYDIRFDSAARILPTVEVRGKMVYDRAMKEFDEAKRRGFGIFLGPADIEDRMAFEASDLLRGVPGIEIAGNGHGPVRMLSLDGRQCAPTLVVDGARSSFDIPFDELVAGADVAAMAVYRNPVAVPVEYMSMNDCGAIVIWTKHAAPMRAARSSR